MSYYNEFPGEGGTTYERYPPPEMDGYDEEEEIPVIRPPDTHLTAETMYGEDAEEHPYIPPNYTASAPSYGAEYGGEEYFGQDYYADDPQYYEHPEAGDYEDYDSELESPASPSAITTAEGEAHAHHEHEEEIHKEEHHHPPAPKRTCGGEVKDGISEDEKLKARLLESFCCQQVQIPPLLPNILKTFTKAAIRTQPRNLEQWAAAYFRAMANGETPPVKERLEYPAVQAENGLTKGFLRILNKQIGDKEELPFDLLQEKWRSLCLDSHQLTKLLEENGINGSHIPYKKFLVCAASSIAREDVGETMNIICSVLTRQPDGVDPYINYDLWWELYSFAAERANVGSGILQDLDAFLKGLAACNYNQIGPKDFLHQNCPPMF